MAPLNLKQSIKGLSFFTRRLKFFGGRYKSGDQMIFDQRGAIHITNKEVTKRNGEVVNVRGIKEAGADSMVLTRPGGGSSSSFSAMKAMEEYKNWAYAAIKVISDEMAGIEWRLFKKSGEKKTELDTHPLLDLLAAVNSHQTGPEFMKTLSQHFDLTGNAYILKFNSSGDPVTGENEKPAGIFLLDPSRVKLGISKTKYPYTVIGYTFTIDSREFSYKPFQVIHIKDPDPNNPFIGKGTVQGIAEWISNDNSATKFLHQFYDNGAQIGVTFETDMTSEDQLHELKESFNEQHAGVDNAYKAIFLPKGVTKATNDVKFDDVGFDETTNTNRDKILAGFRVPKTILGAAESDTNRATAETADYVFARRTIKPKMLMICSYLNEFLVPLYGDNLILTFTDPVPEDRLSKSNEMKNAVGGIPVITPNEARDEFMGMEPIEGGDVMLTPNTMVPIEDAGKVPAGALSLAHRTDKKSAERGSVRRKVGYMPSRSISGKTQFARNAELRHSMTEEISKAIVSAIATARKKGVNDMTSQEYEDAVLKGKRDRAAAAAGDIKTELQKINQAQMEEALRHIEEATKSLVDKKWILEGKEVVVKAVDISKLFDLDKWINITINALTPIATRIFKNEAEAALHLIDKPGIDVVNTPSAQTAIERAMRLMSQSYNQDTVDKLERKLTEGLEQGYGVPKLAELVRDIYAWKDSYAAERVALTESNRITNTAGKIAWKESGVVKEIKWVTLASDACPFCQDMDGETISVTENFFKRGESYTVENEDGEEETMEMDYSSIGGPPLHPNCRCGIKPVVTTTIDAAAVPDSEKHIDEAIEEIQHAAG